MSAVNSLIREGSRVSLLAPVAWNAQVLIYGTHLTGCCESPSVLPAPMNVERAVTGVPPGRGCGVHAAKAMTRARKGK
jgi:hypothetical protein